MPVPLEPDPFDDDKGKVLRLPPGARCRLKDARRFVCENLQRWGATPSPDVALLTSEVVTNAVVHAGGEVDVRVRRDGACALVEVRDHSPEPPEVLPLDHRRQSGNGMRIVNALARDWGVSEIHDDGKIVWFEIALRT